MNAVQRPVLLLVDNRPSDFTRYVLGRPDVEVVLLRFDDFARTVPNWPSWGRLPQWYREATAGVASFDVRADRRIKDEVVRYADFAASLPARPAYFCNPEEHIQGLAQRFAGLAGLPHLSGQQVRWVRDKPAMKDRFAELGIATARYRRVSAVAEIRSFADRSGWPVVLKPVDSFATIDTYRIDSGSHLDDLAGSLPSRDWMVEEFIAGREYQLCALVARGRVLDTFISFNPCPLLETLDGSMNADVTIGPRCPEYDALHPQVTPLVQRLVDGMAIEHGYLHMEFFVRTDGTVVMSEIGARLAGCGIPANHGLAFGFDIFGATLDVYLRRVPALRYTRASCVGDLLLPAKAGRVVDITPAEQLCRLPGVISASLEVSTGEVLSASRASNARSGIVHVQGASVPQVLARMQAVLDRFELTVVSHAYV